MSFVPLCPPLCCQLGQCECREGHASTQRVGANSMLASNGHPLVLRAVVPADARGGREERRGSGSFVTLLFSLCAFDTGDSGVSAGERGGPGSHADWSPVLVHSSGTVRGSWGGWV